MLLNVAQKLLLTEDKRVSEDTLINGNISIVNRILANTLKSSPEIIKIINHPKLRNLPFYLETPNELDGYAKEIELLRSLYVEND